MYSVTKKKQRYLSLTVHVMIVVVVSLDPVAFQIQIKGRTAGHQAGTDLFMQGRLSMSMLAHIPCMYPHCTEKSCCPDAAE